MKAFVKTTLFIVALTGAQLAGTQLVSADVYKYIDENGNVAYGDKPVSGSEQVKIQKAKRPKPQVQDEGESGEQPQSNRNGGSRQSGDEDAPVVYKSLEILTPKNEKVIEDLKTLQGRYVKLKYKERYAIISWLGDTKYFILEVEEDISPHFRK